MHNLFFFQVLEYFQQLFAEVNDFNLMQLGPKLKHREQVAFGLLSD